jgi:hypothetical protein
MLAKIVRDTNSNNIVNKKAVQRAILCVIIGVYCFYKGLDEFNDYLRFYHGMWHLAAGAFSFYFLQGYEKNIFEFWEVGKLYKSIKKTHL